MQPQVADEKEREGRCHLEEDNLDGDDRGKEIEHTGVAKGAKVGNRTAGCKGFDALGFELTSEFFGAAELGRRQCG